LSLAVPVSLALLVWIAFIAVFALVGQPGWYGEQLFVVFKDQADVSSAKSIQDYGHRRLAVYHTLVSQAENSQANLRQALNALGIRFTPYYLVNGLEVNAGPLVRLWLLTRPEVDRVLDSPHLRPLPGPIPVAQGTQSAPASPQWNLTMEQANLVWDELKVTGKGVIVGQSDSGVDGQHPELSAQYVGRNGQNDYAWLDPWFGSREPVDIGGHGTHTLGSILGKTVGVAPNAQWIGCVNLARNLGNPALYLNCMQFMLAPYPQDGDPFKDGRPERGAHVLNNSWGCPDVEGCDAAVFLPAVRALSAAGIFVVVSAGNDGEYGCASLDNPPAIYADVFSVGAVDASGNRASFSSLGPVTIDGSQRFKPDLVAPGERVLSAFPQGTYEIESGTSMAGPQVVGVVALMWSANPKLIGDIDRTRQILIESARPYSGTISACGPANTAGYGIVNAYRAVQAAQNTQ
jgi:subtilisin family serine protease